MKLSPTRFLPLLLVLGLSPLAAAGCASESDSAAEGAPAESEGDLTASSDEAVKGKLAGILRGVLYMSEGDYPYTVLEGGVVPAETKRLTNKVLRQSLSSAIKAASSSQRDIALASCRADRGAIGPIIAAGENIPNNPEDDELKHDRQLSIALKYMRKELRSVVAYDFGTSASGDQDDRGPVVIVYAGISKRTGKVIAIMTEAVWT